MYEFIYCLGGAVMGALLAFWVKRGQAAHWAKAQDALQDDVSALEVRLAVASHERDEVTRRLERTKHMAEEESRKRLEQFRQIEGIIGERDEWKNMALRNGREHSVAQELLLRECQRLARGTNKQVHPRLEGIVEAYKQEFAGADPEAARRIGVGKRAEESGESVTETPEAVANPPTDA